YNWSVTQGTITAGQGTNNIDVTWGTGTGNVVVSASNSCGSNSPFTKSFTGVSCRESSDLAQNNIFSVYPNPVHDKLTVSIYVNEHTSFNLKLRDISGRVILSEDQQGAAGSNVYDMDLKGFAKGIYMLEIQSAAERWKTKVIIE
ncbi:MAG: T9SS type A sorting domain-containing protein, partial [Bacteroidia bacterium]